MGFQQLPLWQYGLWSFQARGKKLERFLQKNQHIVFPRIVSEETIRGNTVSKEND